MSFNYFSRNGEILPIEQAVVPIDNVAYSYGFGVYETLRVSGSMPYFLDDHVVRLQGSAAAIDLEHSFSGEFVAKAIRDLIERNEVQAANIKILLIGGHTKDDAQLYILALNPLFPDRKLYKTGVHTIAENYERLYPNAKTLNMLPSYLIYRKATRSGAYDALLVNRRDEITEGTRTNFFVVKGKTIINPPTADILEGVMRKAVLRVAAANGFTIVEQPIPLASLGEYDAAFLTSTSTKIMPIHSIDEHEFGELPLALTELMERFGKFYKNCNGKL